MKRSDRAILAGLACVGVLAALWFLVIAPKREQASELGDQVAELEATVSEQETLAAQAEAAEADFPRSYSAMVRLGKAVPSDSDTASLVDQLDTVSSRSGASFLSLVLAADEGAAPVPAAPAPAAPTDAATDATPTNLSAGGAVPATETSVAQAPLGAGVGPAGLLAMPYDLKFVGEFEGLADFFGELDAMVHVDPDGQLVTRGSEAAKGRLLTINGFSLELPEEGAGGLEANMRITSYVTPPTQGLTAGATESGPAAEVPAPAPVESSTASTPAPTAAVAP